MSREGQTANPWTGRAVPSSDPNAHFYFDLVRAMMNKRIAELADLVGEEISAVCFVRDYVEVRFDGPILRALSHPVVVAADSVARFPEPGSRDALSN